MTNGRLYSVVTLYECMQDPAALAWLVQTDVPLPGITPPGRYPAPSEIRAVIDDLAGLQAHYRVSNKVWQVTVASQKDVSWAILSVKAYSGDPDEPQPFEFTAGWDEVILVIAAGLAKICGPLVLLHDSGAAPQVVM